MRGLLHRWLFDGNANLEGLAVKFGGRPDDLEHIARSGTTDNQFKP